MRLIGTYLSPYTRRVAISMKVSGLPFTHESLSVFKDFAEFATINPAVKAPTLVTGDGTVLVDSTLILQYLDRANGGGHGLHPSDLAQFARSQRIVGFALAACEKTVQLAYERNRRPAELQYDKWIERVTGQLLAAYGELEREMPAGDAWLFGPTLLQADISTAVAWAFTQHVFPDLVERSGHPRLEALQRKAEAHPAFQSCPIG